MIDHTSLPVSNFEKSKKFYQEALAPIGYSVLAEYSAEQTGHGPVAGFGENGKPDFWFGVGPIGSPIHVAFGVKSREIVDAFYKAAIKAGGKDNGAPGLRPHYHKNYYGAFVRDPDGHNIEAVCHV